MAAAPAIDFYLYARHEIPTWTPIVSALRDHGADARFVLEPPGRNLARGSVPDSTRGWHDDKASHLTALVDADTYRALLGQLTAAGQEPLPRLRPGADAAITSAGVRWIRPWSGARIRCMYGVGLVVDAWGHGAINAGFDLVLAPGPFSRREIAATCPEVDVAIVGYPKWAAYRRLEITHARARHELQISPSSTRVLVWLPTWSGHSSIDRYADAFLRLGRDHTLLVKPHHNTVRFESERLERFRRAAGPSVSVLPASADIRFLVAAADVVVSDVRSGALTEAILGDRPTIALVDTAQNPDHLHPLAFDAVEVCAAPDQLSAAIEATLVDERKAARATLALELFGPADGHDDRRAAAAILGCIHRVGQPRNRRLTAPGWRLAYRAARRIGR